MKITQMEDEIKKTLKSNCIPKLICLYYFYFLCKLSLLCYLMHAFKKVKIYSVSLSYKKVTDWPWMAWFSWLECCPVHQKFRDLIPSQGTYLHAGSIPGRAPMWGTQSMILSLFLPSSLSKINVYVYHMYKVTD